MTVHSDSLGQRTFHTSRNVAKDEELCISYLKNGFSESRQARKAELLRRYNFDCQCPGCGDSVEARQGEQKRAELAAIEQGIVNLRGSPEIAQYQHRVADSVSVPII